MGCERRTKIGGEEGLELESELGREGRCCVGILRGRGGLVVCGIDG
jgi:hypothetical protein